MDSTAQRLAELIAPAIAALDFELLGCEYFQQGRQGLLRIYIDSPNGIGVKDCERVSRQVSALLDVADPITGGYRLEVSSPGVQRPLFTLAHYQRYLGQMVEVRLRYLVDGRRHICGKLQSADEENVVLQVEEALFTLPFAAIQKSHLVVKEE